MGVNVIVPTTIPSTQIPILLLSTSADIASTPIPMIAPDNSSKLPYTMTKNGWIRIRSSNTDVTVMANGMAIYRGINTAAVVPLAAGTVISASVTTGLTIGLVQ